MRWRDYHICLLFKADELTGQLWDLKEAALANHNLKTDIIYRDLSFPLKSEYEHVFELNETS
jgi:hypothetical protein